VSPAFVAENWAPGAISQAIALGEIILEKRPAGGEAVAGALVEQLGGRVLAKGPARDYQLETRGGYDVGRLQVAERLATFPDLIATLDASTGDPVVTAELSDGRELLVVAVPKARLLLGAGVRRPESLAPAEAAVGREMARYF